MDVESREACVLASLRRLSRRQQAAFERVFVEVCRNARSTGRTPAERAAWGDIEEAIRIDLRPK